MRIFGPGLLCVALAACGGSTPPPEAPVTPSKTQAAAPVKPGDPLPANSVRRSSVRAVLVAGPGAFLQRLTLDDRAVFQSGKFHGFRVQHLNDSEFWKGVDLKAGDVVTHINGFPIEHPEEALEAFKSLEVASELRVGYEREGVPRELRYTIVDDEPAGAVAAPPPSPAPAPAPAKPAAKPVK